MKKETFPLLLCAVTSELLTGNPACICCCWFRSVNKLIRNTNFLLQD